MSKQRRSFSPEFKRSAASLVLDQNYNDADASRSMREQGATIGRFKVSRLMDELGLICKQPGGHGYKRAPVERVDIPNMLNRQFNVAHQNLVWCGEITYLWAQGRWHYLAVVLDLLRAASWVGRSRRVLMPIWSCKHWT